MPLTLCLRLVRPVALLVSVLMSAALATPDLVAAVGERTSDASWVALRGIPTERIDDLVRRFEVRGTYGDLTLLVADELEIRELTVVAPNVESLGDYVADERLFVVVAEAAELASRLPTGSRILYAKGGRAVVALPSAAAVDPMAWHEPLGAAASASHGHLFHDGVAAVSERRQRPVDDSLLPAAAPIFDNRIAGLVALVDSSRIEADVESLSTDFTTRRSDTAEAIDAQNWLKGRFEELGYAAELFDFDFGADNVVAELTGTLEPEAIVIVGGHYDTISFQGNDAPGADDNASGSAAVLEIARIFAEAQPEFRYSIRFILFAAEEFGLVGAEAYSAMLRDTGVPVIAMLNTDMNSYLANGDTLDLDFVTNNTTPSLNELLLEIHEIYLPDFPAKTGSLAGGTSDHQAFFSDGFPAAFYFEDASQFSPFIHGPGDTLGASANNFELSGKITQSILAGLATLADPIDLDVQHDALGDTEDEWNPYPVIADVVSLIGSTPTDATLFYDVGEGEVEVAMRPTGIEDEWIADIPAQPTGASVSYRIEAVDDLGFAATWPVDGSSVSFLIGERRTYYSEDFDAGEGGWAHSGQADDWEFGTPQGSCSDASEAFSGVNVFGNDLGAVGFNGCYQGLASNVLTSPPIDATARTGSRLRYRRWLSVEEGIFDQATIRANGSTVWENPAEGNLVDSEWLLHDIDVSTIDGDAAAEIEFTLASDGGLEFGGWNIDDIELYTLATATRPALTRDGSFLPIAEGGSVEMTIDFGPGFANRQYIVLGGASGSEPGFVVDGTLIPLNEDVVTGRINQINDLLPGFIGTTDGSGRAQATFVLLPDKLSPSFAGSVMTFVAVTRNATDIASNPVELRLVP